jgi:hypothetical protein
MKIRFLVFFCAFVLFFQESFAQLPKKKWFPQRSYQALRPYWALQTSFGIKRLALIPTLFALNYDHPDSDTLFLGQENIQALQVSGGNSWAFNANFAVEAGFTKGFFGELRFDFLATKPFINSFEVGAGWNFEFTYYENERLLTLRPAVDLVFLSNQITIGSYNFPPNRRSIAMVDAIFERQDALTFRLRNTATGLKPRLSISQPLSAKWALRADIGYLFILNKRSTFMVHQKNINQWRYKLSPDEPRLGFTMNGITSRTDLFTYSGFFATIGIARKFGDNRDNGRRYKGRYTR